MDLIFLCWYCTIHPAEDEIHCSAKYGEVWPSFIQCLCTANALWLKVLHCKLGCLNQHKIRCWQGVGWNHNVHVKATHFIHPIMHKYPPTGFYYFFLFRWWNVMLILPLLLSVNMIICMTPQCKLSTKALVFFLFFEQPTCGWMATVAWYIMGVTWMLCSMAMETR